jgi:arginyl-tRNA synthetase
MLEGVIKEAKDKGIAKVDQGAVIVDLTAHGIETPCLLQKSDGATLYATRDIAFAKYRHDRFGGEASEWQSLYVVDQGQSLHFKQVFKTIELLGYAWGSKLKHIPFGVMLVWSDEDQAWIKGKTRSGNVVLLEDVLNEATRRVVKIIDERNPALPNKEATARAIGVGAVVFNDLKNKRTNDVKFKFEDALSLEGETGPYVHNALVRTKSILRKANRPVPAAFDVSLLTHQREGEIALLLASFRDAVARAGAEHDPSLICRYLLDLSGALHAFHHDCLVLDENNKPLSDARLVVVDCVRQVLENGMRLVGLQPIEAM